MSLQSSAGGRIIWGVLGPEDYAATGCTAADTEAIIDLFKQADQQDVCILFKTPRDPGKWQISLRSRTVDVAAVAREYGGGGHARAAGFDFEGDLAEVRSALLARLSALLAGAEGT
jgi:phosphoesterase RecJ-like protein